MSSGGVAAWLAAGNRGRGTHADALSLAVWWAIGLLMGVISERDDRSHSIAEPVDQGRQLLRRASQHIRPVTQTLNASDETGILALANLL